MEYTNSQIKALIREHIHNQVDRKMLYYRLVDGLTFAQIGTVVKLDPKTVRKRIHSQEEVLFSHIKDGN